MTQKSSDLIITNEMYDKFKNMIWKAARSFNRSTGVPVEELVACGNETFCKCIATHDAERGSFSTYLYLSLESKLIGFCSRWRLWSAVDRRVSHHKVAIKLQKRKESRGRTVVYSTVRTEDIVYVDSDTYDTDAMYVGSHDLTLRRLIYEDWLKTLSSDARAIVSMVTTEISTEEAKSFGADGSTVARIIRSRIRKQLRKHGWTRSRTNDRLNELKRRVLEL